MWLRIAAAGHRIMYLSTALVRIRKHDGNMSRHADRMRDNMRRVRRKAFCANVVPRSHAGFWLRLEAVDLFQAGWMYWDERRTVRALLYAAASIAIWPLPLDRRDLHEPPFFRLRAALRFLVGGLFRKRRA
jgi:hypothetical protein